MSDYKWYHPMLGGAGLAANALEEELGRRISAAGVYQVVHDLFEQSRSAWRPIPRRRCVSSDTRWARILLALIAWN